MNRRIRKHILQAREKLAEIDAELDFVDALLYDGDEEEPAEEEPTLEAKTVDTTNWTHADEPEKEGIYLKDLRELTELKGLAIIGEVKTVFDLKSYVKKDGGAGLIYRVVLSDPTGDVTVIAFDEMATKLKQYTIGQHLRITNAWKMQENKNKVRELHIGNFAKIEVVE